MTIDCSSCWKRVTIIKCAIYSMCMHMCVYVLYMYMCIYIYIYIYTYMVEVGFNISSLG